MFDSELKKFTDKKIIPREYEERILEVSSSYIEENELVNHRSRNYIFGGAILFVLHNNTDTIYRPKTIAKHLGEDFSPSKVTFAAYKIEDFIGEEYQKPTTQDFAHYYAKKLDCREEVHELIDEIYQDVGELAGKSNSGTGAAILYISSLLGNDKRTQSKISETSGRSKVGIRNLYYEVLEESTLDVDLA